MNSHYTPRNKSEKYNDIIRLPHPVSGKHPHMSAADRAKQFCPFAALKGYDEAVRKRQQLFEPRPELSDDALMILDRRLNLLEEQLKNGIHPLVTVSYFLPAFCPANSPETGTYQEITGTAARLSRELRFIHIIPVTDSSLLPDTLSDVQNLSLDNVFDIRIHFIPT